MKIHTKYSIKIPLFLIFSACEGYAVNKIPRGKWIAPYPKMSEEDCATFCSVNEKCKSWTTYNGYCFPSEAEALQDYNGLNSGYNCNTL